MKRLILLSIMTLAWCATAPRAAAQSVPPLMNYQGQILNPDGTAPPTADYTLSFRIYDAPEGGNLIWGPQLFDGRSGPGLATRIPVVQGYFNVTLGPTDTAARSLAEAFDGSTRYLEITISNRPPVAPRQQIMSAPFALKSKRADEAALADQATLAGSAQFAGFATNAARSTVSSAAENVAGLAASEVVLGLVPVGTVLPYYGELTALPSQWKYCDGTTVTDSSSPLYNTGVPDLREMFLRGSDSSYALGAHGGTDYIDSHGHSVSASGSAYIGTRGLNGWSGRNKTKRADEFHPTIYSLVVDNSIGQQDQETHGHTGSAYVYGYADIGGEHDNRPRFCTVHFIIRVK